MKVVAAYLLAVLGGNTTPSIDDIKNILGSVGADAEDERIELLLSQVKGKDLAELIAAGREKLAVTGGGSAVAAGAAAATTASAATASAPAAAEPKKEEKIKESDDEAMFSLFD